MGAAASVSLVRCNADEQARCSNVAITHRQVCLERLYVLSGIHGVVLDADDPYGLYSLRGESGTNWGYLMAGMTLSAVPMIILYLCAQKQFIRGLSVGSVKE